MKKLLFVEIIVLLVSHLLFAHSQGYYKINGQWVETSHTHDNGTVNNDDDNNASGVYISEVGDKILVIDGQTSISYMGINLNKLNANQNKLIISLAGAGVWADAKNETDGVMETLTFGDTPSSNKDYGDMLYKKAYSYLTDNKTVSVIGYPWFTSAGDIAIDDTWWGPQSLMLASRISEALALMAPDTKLILIGKSMGACKLQQIVNGLSNLNVEVDLLVLVDASCTLTDQSNQYKNIYTNVKKVFNFHQTADYPIDADWQNGFQISYSSPTEGYNIDVTNYSGVTNSTMCPDVGHDNIDECQNILDYIDMLVNAELKGKINDLSAILQLLLD